MAVTASDFRKNLFTLLDKAAHGENVEINYKGVVLKLIGTTQIVPKLSRVKKRAILAVPPEEIVSNGDFQREMEAEWEEEGRQTRL